jgi:hypothetical protein
VGRRRPDGRHNSGVIGGTEEVRLVLSGETPLRTGFPAETGLRQFPPQNLKS